MSSFGKIVASALIVLPLSIGGCKPNQGTANPEDYFPLIQVALAGGETVAMIGRNEAIKGKSFEGCVASAALLTGFDGAGQVLAGRLGDKIVIPAVDIDVSECLALRQVPDVEEPDEENASLQGPVQYRTMVAGYAAPAEDAPAEEPAAEEPSAEEAPAEEPPAEEPPAEEPAAEEPVAEEPVAEVPTAAVTKGNAEAAMLVETLAGFTIAAVLSYSTKLQTANCKKGTAAIGAVNYVAGMIQPIADEIAEPDGKISVPAVAIDLSECEG